jgi:alpha-amylase
LRNAVYQHLIAAENLLNQAEGRGWQTDQRPWVELEAGDYNLDGRPEVRLANNRLLALVAPVEGGQLYELDVKAICHNVQSSLTRRAEAYHRKVQRGPNSGGGDVASIHDLVVFKQEGLQDRLQYDNWARNSLIDHFYAADVPRDQIIAGTAQELGDFVHGPYEAKLRRNPGRVQLLLTREGRVAGEAIKVTKGITLTDQGAALEIAYYFENLPAQSNWIFAPEFNFAGLPAGIEDRFFRTREGQPLGHLGCQLDLLETQDLGLVDHWLGIDLLLSCDAPTAFWTYPVETVSQSEGGFELVHQSVAVLPHWQLVPDAKGCWSVTLQLTLDTSLAEQRMGEPAVAASA